MAQEKAYIIYHRDAVAVEKSASPALKQAWERARPAASIIIEKAYGDLAAWAENIVRLVFLKGSDALKQLAGYLQDNLGTKEAEAGRIAGQLQSAMAVFVPPAQKNAPAPASAPAPNPASALAPPEKALEWDDPRVMKALREIETQWRIEEKSFRAAVKRAVGAGTQAVRALPAQLQKELNWSAVRAHTIADALAEKVLSQLPSFGFDIDAVRIAWQKTGYVDWARAAQEMGEKTKPAVTRPLTPRPAPPVVSDENTLFAARIVKEIGLRLSGPELEKRFNQVVLARVREIKNANATEELLERKPEQGGLGLTHEESMKVVARMEALIAERADEARRVALLDARRKGAVATGLAERVAFPLQSRVAEHHELAVRSQSLPSTTEPMKEKTAKIIQTSPVPPTAETPPPRALVSDIVPPEPQLAGPLESLQQLRIVDFRRLSAKPELAAAKVKDRIALLRQDSFEEYTQGITAFKSSSLYGAYIQKLLEGVLRGSTSFAATTDSKRPPEDALTRDEFLSLIHLSQELVYV